MNDWYNQAKCRGLTDVFYKPEGVREHPQRTEQRHALARQICGECPVMEQCRAAALAEETHPELIHGVRYGLTAPERIHGWRPTPVRHPHGHYRRYNTGCRCALCTEAKRVHQLEAVNRTREAAAAGLVDIPHGSPRGYQYYACRCDDCKAAARRQRARYPKKAS